jgi:hypothetical protein
MLTPYAKAGTDWAELGQAFRGSIEQEMRSKIGGSVR